METFAPFVGSADQQAMWGKLAWSNRYKALRRFWRRLSRGGTRNQAVISDEYESAWSRGYEMYDIRKGCRRPEPWYYRDQRLVADRAGTPRLRHLMLSAVIKSLRPQNVLEVGCGNGINLVLLAGAFPDIKFTGLELTAAGIKMARELQAASELPAALRDYGGAPASQEFRKIEFIQGDATRMPFEDNQFDLVITILSVEQMEQIRDKALNEITRVAKRHVLNLEPFAEMNAGLWRRMHVYGRDYFRGDISSLPDYGLIPVWATSDYPQEVLLGTALVLSQKKR